MAVMSSLEGKTWQYGLVTGLVLATLIVGAGWYLKFDKMRGEIQGAIAKHEQLQAKIQEGRAAKQRLPQFREEVRRLELELEKLLSILPSSRNTEDLLRRIRNLAEQGDHDLLRFRPGAFIEQDFYREWPISIQLNGSYHNLALFFDRVSRFSRIVNIENLSVGSLETGNRNRTISATFTAKTFLYKEGELNEPAAR